MRIAVLSVCVLALCVIGCANGSGAGTKKSKDAANAGPKAGWPITVEGKAEDGMISALVIDGKGVVYMVPSLGRWPDEIKGKRVRVTGKFVQDDRYKGGVVDGVPQQGTAGNDRIILKAKYEVINDR